MENNAPFFTIPQAAKLFGVDRRTLYRWATSGKIKSMVTPGGHHRIPKKEVERLLEQFKSSTNDATKTKTILIVDDEVLFCTVLGKQLSREKFNVSMAHNGFEAGLKAKTIKPDLLILDINMEGLDGFDVCKQIRSDDSLKDMKIIIYSGYDSIENRKKAIEVGADLFVSKNEVFSVLLAQINQMI